MNLTRQKRRLERRSRFAGEWKLRDAGEAENRLFNGSFTLAEAARELESAAGAAGPSQATTASLGCMSSAFEAIANATLKMRGDVVDVAGMGRVGSNQEELAMLLHAIGQNMRLAAQHAEQARQLAAEVEWPMHSPPSRRRG